MTKTEAIKLFGGVVKLAGACGITHNAVCQWPDTLSPRIADRVIAAAVRHGKHIPKRLLPKPPTKLAGRNKKPGR